MMRAITISILACAAGIAVAQVQVTSHLKDLTFERTAPDVLMFGKDCSTSTPCNVRFNQHTYSIPGGKVFLSQSPPKGKAFAYVTAEGKVAIGTKLSIARCDNCAVASGIDNFPPNTIPLWTWTATVRPGEWDRDGGEDWRALQSAQVITSGPGIIVTQSPDSTSIAVDTVALSLLIHHTPPSSSAPCAPGAIWSDDNYVYVCIASGTIKRAALSTF